MSNEIMATFETAITPQQELHFNNKKLMQHTKAIEKLMTATKRNMFEISARLLVIRNENLFEDDGFKDVFDYAEQLFGYKKNMVYKLTTAAEKFIEASPTGKGYVSILTHDNADYTVSQLIELNSLEPDTAVELDQQKYISPTMSTKEIREVVKSYKNGELDSGNDEADGDENAAEDDGGAEMDKTTKLLESIAKNISKVLDLGQIDSETSVKLEEFATFIDGIINNVD
ncbi:MAG: hypothetical protein ACI37T_02015 [Candidatus Gastranaerophilaceae bacterium]